MNKSSKKLLGSSKKIIIIALVCFALLSGCQQREKIIYKASLSEHLMQMERQERTYRDSLEK